MTRTGKSNWIVFVAGVLGILMLCAFWGFSTPEAATTQICSRYRCVAYPSIVGWQVVCWSEITIKTECDAGERVIE